MYPHFKHHFRLGADDYRRDTLPGVDNVLKIYRPELISYQALKEDQNFLMDLQESFIIRRKKINRHTSALESINSLLKCWNRS